jgi:hypothetical protein
MQEQLLPQDLVARWMELHGDTHPFITAVLMGSFIWSPTMWIFFRLLQYKLETMISPILFVLFAAVAAQDHLIRCQGIARAFLPLFAAVLAGGGLAYFRIAISDCFEHVTHLNRHCFGRLAIGNMVGLLANAANAATGFVANFAVHVLWLALELVPSTVLLFVPPAHHYTGISPTFRSFSFLCIFGSLIFANNLVLLHHLKTGFPVILAMGWVLQVLVLAITATLLVVMAYQLIAGTLTQSNLLAAKNALLQNDEQEHSGYEPAF